MLRRAKGLLFAAVTLLFTLLGLGLLCPEVSLAAQLPAVVTREQFILDLAQQLQLQPASDSAEVFSDLPPSDPSFGLIMAAYKDGWISGYPNGSFQPNASLTREQVAKCEIIALGLQSAASALSAKPPAYADAGSIGRWAWGYVNEAAVIGILRGFSSRTFGPQGVLTTAQVNHAQAQLAAYLAKTTVKGFGTAPTAARGSVAGTSAISVTPNSTGDRIAVVVSSSALAAPTWGAVLPLGAATYTPGDNLAVTANAYIGVYEVNGQGGVVAFSQLQVTRAEIAYPPARLTFSGPQGGTAAGAALIGPFTLTLTDADGNPAPAPVGGVVVELSANSRGAYEFAAAPSGTPITSVTIPSGSTSASIYYGDSLAGSPALSATSPGLATATLRLQISAAAPAKLSLSGPQNAFSGLTALIGPYSLTLMDAFGNPTPAPAGGITATLRSNSQGAYEFAEAPSGTPITSVTLPSGSTGARFYYGDSQAGTPTIFSTSPGLATATLSLQISTDTAAKLTLFGPQSGAAGASPLIGPFTVRLTDAKGNLVPAPAGGVAVALSATAQGSEFAGAPSGAPLTSVTIPPGSSTASFYYGDSQGGLATLSVSASSLLPATQSVAVAVPVSLAGSGLDSPAAFASPSQVQSWYGQGYRTIFLNTFAPSFAQQYANSLLALDVVLFQGYYTPAFTDETGAQRAYHAINAAEAVGYPKGAYIFVDIESTGTATQQEMIMWINSWSAAVQAAGYGAGVYFGVPQPVSASQAYGLLADRFWKSLSSSSITPAVRGVCVTQTGSTSALDEDTFSTDTLGEYCIGAGM